MSPSLLWLLSCSNNLPYQAADLQLDFPVDLPTEASNLRVCVQGVGAKRFGARSEGSFGVQSLPADGTLKIVVDVLDEDSEHLLVGEATLEEDWTEGEVLDCDVSDCEDCRAEGQWALEGESSRMLAIRFVGYSLEEGD